MIRLSINLPTKRRLDLQMIKRRKDLDDTPLLPNLGKVRRVRTGNKLSRYFRHVFEHKKVKRLLGLQLTLLAFLSSFIPSATNFTQEYEENYIARAPLVLTTQQGVRYPLDNIKITQGYKFYHPGVDFDGVTGQNIFPIMAGKVLDTQYSNFAYGNAIVIDHGNYITSLYAHLSQIFVSKDQGVDTSTVIGTVGATGKASGDHLHLEIRDHNYPINPFIILP